MDDESFVILGPGSMPSMAAGPPHQDSPMMSDNGNYVSFQARLQNLITENESLKAQNWSMKIEFEKLSEYQEKVLETHQSHKVKFDETRELVLTLKAENARLKSHLESQKNSIPNAQLVCHVKQLSEEKDCLKEECTRLTLQNSHLEDLIKSKSEEIALLKGNYESLAFMADASIIGSPTEKNTTDNAEVELDLVKLELNEQKGEANLVK